MERTFHLPKWTERSFSFGFAIDFIPFLVERLSATGPRLAEIIASASEDQLAYRPNGKWSAKEHIGHLSDLEDLHIGRLGDFRNRSEGLHAADMANRRTEEAAHNTTDTTTLLLRFRASRKSFLEKLQTLDEASLQHRSLHPRLQVMINVADMLYFMAEHDTHHLTIMTRQLPPGI